VDFFYFVSIPSLCSKMPGIERQTIDKTKLEGKLIVWVMGGPGSGRGTQCEKISLKKDLVHLSSGDLLKHEVMSGSDRGTKLYRLMSTGEAVPNEIVNDIIAETMVKKASGATGFLIDGYPGDEAQADSFVADIGPPNVAICLEISDEAALGRLMSRGNFDDNEGSINKRLKTWNEKTKPVAEKYAAFKIQAERPANEILADIEKALN